MGKKKSKQKPSQRNPNSLANLKNGKKFSATDGSARAAGVKSGIVRRTQAELEKLLDENLADAIDVLTSDSSIDSYMQNAKTATNQMQRILAREFSDGRKAFAAVQWIFDRVKGRPTQVVDNNLSGGVEVVKPKIVFKDIEAATRAAEEKRLQDDTEEDI